MFTENGNGLKGCSVLFALQAHSHRLSRYCIKHALQREVQEYQDLKLTHWESEASLGATVCRCYLHSSLGASTVEAETEALLPEYFSYCFQQSAISQ